MNIKYKTILAASVVALAGCTSDADTALQNVSKASEQFEVMREITMYNSIQDVAIKTIRGKCSVEFFATHNDVICKDENGMIKVHKLRVSDNTTLLVEQLDPVDASVYRYRVLVKPSLIIPDLDLVTPVTEGN